MLLPISDLQYQPLYLAVSEVLPLLQCTYVTACGLEKSVFNKNEITRHARSVVHV